MDRAQQMLKLGALCNFAIALAHLLFYFTGERTLRFFGAPRWVITMQRQGDLRVLLLLVAMAAVFSLFALYGLSGAGALRRLPFLRTVLIAIGVLFVLRGAEAGLDVIIIARYAGRYTQFLGFSLISLSVGLLYLMGTAGVWRQLAQRA
jgi:hypothetical protein